MTELIIDGKSADLKGDEVIALSFAVNNLLEIASRESAYSNTFDIPSTARNRAILENAQAINSATDTPYRRIPCLLKASGSTQIDGYAEVYSHKTQFELNISGDNGALVDRLGDKSMRALILDDLDHIWDYATIVASLANTTGYVYAKMDYSEFTTRRINGDIGGAVAIFNELYPSVFVKRLLVQLFADAGFTVTGGFLADAVFNKMIIPIPAGEYQHTDAFIANFRASAQLDTGFTYHSASGTPPPQPYPLDNELADPLSQFNLGTSTFVAQRNGNVKVTVGQNMRHFNVFVSSFLFIDLELNGVRIQLHRNFDLGEVFIKAVYIKNLYLKTGDILKVILRNTGGESDVEVYSTGNFVKIDYDNRVETGDKTELAFNLPDIKQTDFLLTLVNEFNLIMQTDNSSKTVRLELFDTILSNKPNALNWSEKIDLKEDPETFFKYAEFGQKSYFKYASDDNDLNLKAYRTKTGVDYGSDYLTVNNKNLSATKTMFESVFAATIKGNSFQGALQLPILPKYTQKDQTRFELWDSTQLYSITPVQDYVLYHNRYFRALINDISNIPPLNGTGHLNDTQWVEGTLDQFLDKELFTRQDITPRILVIEPADSTTNWMYVHDGVSASTPMKREVSFLPLAFNAHLLTLYYQALKGILDQTRFIRVLMRLTGADISNLDFTIPVYLDIQLPGQGDLNGYFYLNFIQEYKPGISESCYVELIRL